VLTEESPSFKAFKLRVADNNKTLAVSLARYSLDPLVTYDARICGGVSDCQSSVPHTLHPTPYTTHHTPHTLHSTPYAPKSATSAAASVTSRARCARPLAGTLHQNPASTPRNPKL